MAHAAATMTPATAARPIPSAMLVTRLEPPMTAGTFLR
jgi:hypothetical protein